MQVKVQCGCGAKYSFDVEPVNGQMPVAIQCPQCGADGTAAANEVIRAQLQSTAPAVPAPSAGAASPARLRVAAAHSAAVPVAQAVAVPQAEICSRHPHNAAASHCVVCHKPICLECMSMFGYLCSVGCRYQAEQQGIQVPVYEFQKTLVQNNWWKKVGRITWLIALAIVTLVFAFFWYEIVGSKPKVFYSKRFNSQTAPVDAKFIDKNRILLVGRRSLAMHDVKGQKDLWTAAIELPQPKDMPPAFNRPGRANASEDEDDEDIFDFFTPPARLHLTKDEVWLAFPEQIQVFDLNTGAAKQKLDLPGRIIEFCPDEKSIVVITAGDQRRRGITRIDVASKALQTAELTVSPVERELIAEPWPEGFTLTAAFRLADDYINAEQRKIALRKVYSDFISAGVNAVELQVRMIEPNLAMVETMKKPGPSKLNSGTSVMSDVAAIAEEVFNDIKRSTGGGFKRVDESRYGVTLRRFLVSNVPPWTGEVTGPPAFYAQKTVDLLVAGKTLIIFSKDNRKLAEVKLAFEVDEVFLRSGTQYPPCIEHDNTLYFFDRGWLTAFELPSCNVRWRLPSVGISQVLPDGRGNLYLDTTSGSPDDIKYEEDVKIGDPTVSLVVKVREKDGKVLWKSRHASGSRLSGKYLYAMHAGGGWGLAPALSDALGQRRGSSGMTVYRLNPSNGKTRWEYFPKGGDLLEIDFHQNRFLLLHERELKVLKYLTF